MSEPDSHPLILSTLERTILNLQSPPSEGYIFTDDKAPVERITNSMIFKFMLSEEIENLK